MTANYSAEISFEPHDNKRLMNLCGQHNEHLKQIEKRLNVGINQHGHSFQILGQENAVKNAQHVLQLLYQETGSGLYLTPATIHLFLQEAPMTITEEKGSKEIVFHNRAGVVKPHTANQKKYIENILNNDITFSIGPAGTGKTYLGVACAVDALEKEKVKRVILVRPAVEAGEKLGFLPGDINQKVEPYLRPLYDALFEMLGFERVGKLVEQNIIEIAPLAFMRGRTLNDSFILLDESQNTTTEQMKMFLTRIGFGSKAIVTGDLTQVDLPRGKKSGLLEAQEILSNIDGINFTYFESKDVVRHALVQRIVEAYAKFQPKN